MRPIALKGKSLVLVDQTKLPLELRFVRCKSVRDVVKAINTMQVRGAPALGVVSALALAMVAAKSRARTARALLEELEAAAEKIKRTRPTAINLFAGLERVLAAARGAKGGLAQMKKVVVAEAKRVEKENAEANKRISELGASLIPPGATVLTHCNTGPLACGDHGTALGAILEAWRRGNRIRVIATETRPLLQGARLTAWELKREGVPVRVIVDGAVGGIMKRGLVDLVMVGADRITLRGDVANKIGTYSLAVLAKAHGVPFYSLAPTSSIDPSLVKGEDIPIEHRDPEEIRLVAGARVLPRGIEALNPAFDVTPAEFITAIVTERGIFKPSEIRKLF